MTTSAEQYARLQTGELQASEERSPQMPEHAPASTWFRTSTSASNIQGEPTRPGVAARRQQTAVRSTPDDSPTLTDDAPADLCGRVVDFKHFSQALATAMETHFLCSSERSSEVSGNTLQLHLRKGWSLYRLIHHLVSEMNQATESWRVPFDGEGTEDVARSEDDTQAIDESKLAESSLSSLGLDDPTEDDLMAGGTPSAKPASTYLRNTSNCAGLVRTPLPAENLERRHRLCSPARQSTQTKPSSWTTRAMPAHRPEVRQLDTRDSVRISSHQKSSESLQKPGERSQGATKVHASSTSSARASSSKRLPTQQSVSKDLHRYGLMAQSTRFAKETSALQVPVHRTNLLLLFFGLSGLTAAVLYATL
ncbi:MAG: hypothetical protein AAF355_09625 [Myxococcota bacterium]